MKLKLKLLVNSWVFCKAFGCKNCDSKICLCKRNDKYEVCSRLDDKETFEDNFQGLSKILRSSQDFQRLSRTFEDFQVLQGLSRTFNGFQGLSRTLKDFQGLSSTRALEL